MSPAAYITRVPGTHHWILSITWWQDLQRVVEGEFAEAATTVGDHAIIRRPEPRLSLAREMQNASGMTIQVVPRPRGLAGCDGAGEGGLPRSPLSVAQPHRFEIGGQMRRCRRLDAVEHRRGLSPAVSQGLSAGTSTSRPAATAELETQLEIARVRCGSPTSGAKSAQRRADRVGSMLNVLDHAALDGAAEERRVHASRPESLTADSRRRSTPESRAPESRLPEPPESRARPCYSTVTLLARFLGWSTSQPRRIGDVIREQLEGHGHRDRRHQRMHGRQHDAGVALRVEERPEVRLAFLGDGDHRAAAGLHFLDVAEHLLEHVIARRERHDGQLSRR